MLGLVEGEDLVIVDRTALAPYSHSTVERLPLTSATLLTEADAQLFHDLPFSITVSMDGTRAVHRAMRPMHNGRDSYQAVLDALSVIARVGRPKQITGLPDAHSGPAFSTLVGLAMLASSRSGDLRDLALGTITKNKPASGMIGRLLAAMKVGI